MNISERVEMLTKAFLPQPPPSPQIFHTGIDRYDYPVYDDLNLVQDNVALIVPHFKKLYLESQDLKLVCTGSSGLLIASEMVRQLSEYRHLSVKLIRKDGETSHSKSSSVGSGILIIVDDFVSTGETMRKISNYLHERGTGSKLWDPINRTECLIVLNAKGSNHPRYFPHLKYIIE